MAARAMAELESACRICLMEFPGTMTDIHHKPVGANRIRESITTCVPVKIYESDGGPRFICPHCLTKLQIVMQFREKALNSDKLLQRLWGHQAIQKSNQQIPTVNNSHTNTSSCCLSNASSPVMVTPVYQSQNQPDLPILRDRLQNTSRPTVENVSENNSILNTDTTLRASFLNSMTAPTRPVLLSPRESNENNNSVIAGPTNAPRQQKSPALNTSTETNYDNAEINAAIEKELADRERINNSLSFPDSKREQFKSLINTTIEFCLPESVTNSYEKQASAVVGTLRTDADVTATKPQSRKRRKSTNLSSTDFETDKEKRFTKKTKQKRKKKRSSKKRNTVSRSKGVESDENLSMDSFEDLFTTSNDVPSSPLEKTEGNRETGCDAVEREFLTNAERTNLEESLNEADRAIDELFGGATEQKENSENRFETNETPDNDKKIGLRDRSRIKRPNLFDEDSDCFDDSDADQTWELNNAETDASSNESFDSDRSESDRFKRKRHFPGSRGRPRKICTILNSFSLNGESNIDAEPGVVNSEQESIDIKGSTAVSATPEPNIDKTKSYKPGPLSSKPGPKSSKPGPKSSKPGPLSSKPGPLSSKPGPKSSKPGPLSSKSKPGPKSSKSVKIEKRNSVDDKSTNSNAKTFPSVKRTTDNKIRKVIDYIVIDDDDDDEEVSAAIESNGNEMATTKSKENETSESNKHGTDRQDEGDSANDKKTNESANKEKQPTVYTQISECQHCENWFTMTEAEFVDHVNECSTLTQSCYLCQTRFKDIFGLQKHLGKRHLKELQICVKCMRMFFSLMHYWSHRCDESKTTAEEVEIVDDVKKYQCGVCDRNYDTVQLFIQHFERTHSESTNDKVQPTLANSD